MNHWRRIAVFSFMFIATFLVARTTIYYLQLFRGVSMIKNNDKQALERLVKGNSRLATGILGDAYQEGKIEIFELLLKNGADVNVAYLKTEFGPYPLLHHLARRETEPIWLETAFVHGGNPNKRSRNQITPLSESLHGRLSTHAMLALKYGADVRGRFDNGQQHYDAAVEYRQFEPAFYMLANGADPNAETFLYSTAIKGIQQCWTGQGIDKTSAEKARQDVWYQKIIKWYRDRDMDVLNATFEFTDEKKGVGKWRIPSFSNNQAESFQE